MPLRTGGDTTVQHNFKYGIAMIGVRTATEIVDASVTFQETKTRENIIARRTYTSNTSNPKKFILNPGTYNVIVVGLGKHKGNTRTIAVVVEAEKTKEKTVTF